MDEFDVDQADNKEYVLNMIKKDGKLLDLHLQDYKMMKKL